MIAAYLLLIQTATPWLPNPALTPGDVDPRLTDAVLRASGFTTKKYRPAVSVTNRLKVQAFKAYGIPVTPANMAAYELDHEIPISEGGATTLENLWPEPWSINVNGTERGAHVKDRLEDFLDRQIRAGKLSGSDARKLIVGDWTVEYLKVFGKFPVYGAKS